MLEEDVVVVRHAGIVASAADMGLERPETAGQEVGVESLVGSASMEMVRHEVVRMELRRCFHMDAVAAPVSDVPQLAIVGDVAELGSGVDLAGAARCAAYVAVVLAHMAGSDVEVRCMAVAEMVGTAEAVVLEVGRYLAAEKLMQQSAVVLSSVAVPEQPASSGEKWLSVRSAMLSSPTPAAVSHPASARHERHSDQAADSLRAAKASEPDGATSSAA